MKIMEIIRDIGTGMAMFFGALLAVAGVYGVSRLIKRYLTRMKGEKNRQKRDPELEEYRKMLMQCTDAWNALYALEPDKNDKYRRAFARDGGVAECMDHCCEVIEKLLGQVERTEDMQLILYGSGIVYLENALRKLAKTEMVPPGKMTPGEFLNYLKDRNVEVDESNPEKGRMKLRQIYMDLQKDIEAEKESKARRELLVQIETKLRSGRLAELMEILKNPPAACTAQQYLSMAGEFRDLLDNLRRQYRAD